MAKLIKLTHLRGQPFYLNAEKIVEVRIRHLQTEEPTEEKPEPPTVEFATVFHETLYEADRAVSWTDVDETAEQVAAIVEGR